MKCRKCAASGTLVIRKEYWYCNDCFVSNIDHKFRACLGKNKKIPWNEKVLICLSGGRSSMTLLDLVYNAISINSHKKLKINPYFIHLIDNKETTADNEIARMILNQCNKYNFHVNMVNINQYYTSNNVITDSTNVSHYKRSENIQAGFECESSTTTCDLLKQIKRHLFVRAANELQCSIIFTGESTTTLAVNLLSSIALGRGSQISNDIGFADKRYDNIEILRPMKDITAEEIDHYIAFKEIPTASVNGNEGVQSLQSTIENFVLNLQDNFPATLTTVCKTADKISSIGSPTDKKCRICMSNVDNEFDKLTAVKATNFSRIVSNEKFDDAAALVSRNLRNEDMTSLNASCPSCQRFTVERNN